jgi:Tfp pilus assembly protein PilF
LKMAPASSVAPDAQTWLAMMQLEGSKTLPSNAADQVSNVLRQDANYIPALLAQAAIAVNTGDNNRAVTLYRQVIDRFPDYAPAQKRLAALYASNPEDSTKAYDLAMKARKNLPEDNELTHILAVISYQRKEYPRALELFEETGRNQPLDATDLYYIGICSLQTKDTVHAREALTNALANGLKDPLAADARRALQDIK